MRRTVATARSCSSRDRRGTTCRARPGARCGTGTTLGGKLGVAQYLAGYLWNIKPRNSDTFVGIASAAGVKKHHDGVGLAGVRLTPIKDLRIDVSNHYGEIAENWTLHAAATSP